MATPSKLSSLKRLSTHSLSILIVGVPGAGKTFFLRDFTKVMKPILYVSLDGGERSFQDLCDEESVFGRSASSITEIEALLDVAKSGFFKTIMLDGLHELHRTLLQAQADRRAQKGGSLTQYELTQQDYGVARTQFLHIVGSLAKVGNYFIATCHLAAVRNDMGMEYWEPSLPGRLAIEVPGFFDISAALVVQHPSPNDVRAAKTAGKEPPESKRILLTNSTPSYIELRNRGGLLPASVEPSLSKIVQVYEE